MGPNEEIWMMNRMNFVSIMGMIYKYIIQNISLAKGSYNYAIAYLKLNGIPRQSVSRYLSNISKAYPKNEAGPELLTTRYCTIWERYPPWSSIIYSRVQECFVYHEHPWFTGHVTSKHWPRNQSMPWKSHVLTSGYYEGRSCGYQILSERAHFKGHFPIDSCAHLKGSYMDTSHGECATHHVLS